MIKELTDEIGVRQDKLARYLGISKWTMMMWHKGEKVPTRTLGGHYETLRLFYKRQVQAWAKPATPDEIDEMPNALDKAL